MLNQFKKEDKMRKKIDEIDASSKTIAEYLTLRDSLSKLYMSGDSHSAL